MKKIYASKDIMPLLVIEEETEKTCLHRLIGLVEKGIIIPDLIMGQGHASTRYYSKATILEILIAFKLIRFGVSYARVAEILRVYRVKPQKDGLFFVSNSDLPGIKLSVNVWILMEEIIQGGIT